MRCGCADGSCLAEEARDNMKIGKKSSELLTWLTEAAGVIGMLLILYCMIFGVSDVFMRYVLNRPSLWIGTTLQIALVILACVAGGYSYYHGDFIKLDLLYAKFSQRTKAVVDVITSVFTFMFLTVLIWKGWQAGMFSLKLHQVTPTAVPIPIAPIKLLIPAAGVLMLLLVVRQLYRDIRTIIGLENDIEIPYETNKLYEDE